MFVYDIIVPPAPMVRGKKGKQAAQPEEDVVEPQERVVADNPRPVRARGAKAQAQANGQSDTLLDADLGFLLFRQR